MAHPTVIIELLKDKFEALYSNKELSIVIVNRTEDEDTVEISGPYAPTLETPNLASVIEGVEIPDHFLAIPAKDPFFTITDPEIVESRYSPTAEDDGDDEFP